MSEEQYNKLLKAYTKEVLSSMIKADIRSRFPELLLSSDSYEISFKIRHKKHRIKAVPSRTIWRDL